MNIADILPERTAEDIFAMRIRLVFGGTTFVLPTLTWDAEDRWLASINTRLAGIFSSVESSRDDVGKIMAILGGAREELFDLLYAYDETHVLPPVAELKGIARSFEVIVAILSVWRAANPLVDMSLAGMMAETQTPKPSGGKRRGRSSGPRPNGTGTLGPSVPV